MDALLFTGYIIIAERAGLCGSLVHYFTSGIVQNNEYMSVALRLKLWSTSMLY
jgi:hypothetical protein